STRLATLHGAELTTTAKRRSVEMPELIHLLKGDLDWVVMKCLEKDRTRRYETANGLAMDLNRHLDNEPVVARPPSTAYRFQKAFRRNKGAFAAAAAVLMALMAGLGLTAWQAVRAKNAEQAEKTHAGQARADRDRALRAEAEAREQALATRNAWAAARRAAYAAEISVAFQALAENNLGRARELLNRQRPKDGEEDSRGFEWRYLWQLCRGDEIATFPDQGAEAVAFSPDGRYVAYGHKTIVVRDAVSRQEIKRLPAKSSSLSFAPDARLLASGHDSGVSLWNTERWQIVRSLSDAKPPTLFSPDGRWLVTGVEEGFRVWNTQTWQPLGDCPGAPDVRHYARNAVAFSPDSQFLITVAGKSMPTGDHLRVWRLPGLERLPDLRQDAAEPGSVAFTVDGKQVVAGLWDGRILVWDFATGKVVAARKGHTSLVTVVAMAADGRTFITASVDRTIIVWDSVTFEPLARRRGHVAEVWSLALSPDGRTAASGSLDGTTKLWGAHAGRTESVLDGASLVAGFAEGGRNLVAFATNSLCVWAPESGERVDFPVPVRPPPMNNNWGRPYAVRPGEPLGVRGCEDGKVEIWSLTNGTKVAEWSAHAGDIGAITFSPDGKHLATGSTKGEVKLWDFRTRSELAQFEPGKGRMYGLAFSPDGATLAGSILNRRVWLWDAGTRKEIQLDGSEGDMSFVAFSGTGKLLVATTVELNEARLWELPSGKQAGVLKGHVAAISAAAFSADGKILATGGMDRKVKLWDVATRQELATFPLGIPIPTLDFSPDGRILAVGDLSSVGHGIQVLRAPTFEEIARTEAGERKEGKEP
ncbi:MAG TPA: hypothetical protein VJS65_05450, partial [Verrucomicrobiae bacterium]|nr:hypothetical protein [Verrucomicrobiae bacterium]